MKPSWPQVCDGKGAKGDIAKLFHVENVPASYLLDRDGRIAAKNVSAEKLPDLIAALVRKPTSASEQEERLRILDIITALSIQPDSSVADVGAGSGAFLARLAEAVGPTGRVYAVDTDEKMVQRLQEKVEKEKWSNVTVARSLPDNPRLPPGQLRAAVIVNSYHEMDQYLQMLSHLLAALQPGGRLVVVDMMPRKTRNRSRGVQVKNHVLAPELAEAEIGTAGFEIVSRVDDFIDRADEEEGRWMIIARKPPAAGTLK